MNLKRLLIVACAASMMFAVPAFAASAEPFDNVLVERADDACYLPLMAVDQVMETSTAGVCLMADVEPADLGSISAPFALVSEAILVPPENPPSRLRLHPPSPPG